MKQQRRQRIDLSFVLALLCLGLASTARADLILTDAFNRATVMVTDAPSPAPGHMTYTFSVAPKLVTQQVSSIDAMFGTLGLEMRQVNPGMASTVFQDFNVFFGGVGEDPSGLGDSQFRFLSSEVLVGTQSEGPLSLSAAFTGFTPIESNQAFAHVVLPEGDFGTFDLEFIVRDIGALPGAGETAVFSSVSFGGAVAIPEAGQVLVWSVIGMGTVLRRQTRRRRQLVNSLDSQVA